QPHRCSKALRFRGNTQKLISTSQRRVLSSRRQRCARATSHGCGPEASEQPRLQSHLSLRSDADTPRSRHMARQSAVWIVTVVLLVLAAISDASEESTSQAADGAQPQREITNVCSAATPSGWHLPYPGDCSLFVKCEPVLWGAATAAAAVFRCPAPLHFNPRAQVCDWPRSAGCDDDDVIGIEGSGYGAEMLP
ncbi:Probable chitinase 10, partial [Gryllus bimaculatus]